LRARALGLMSSAANAVENYPDVPKVSRSDSVW
jgi:hypothetical protein